jgi:hypothetical protein
MAKADLTRFPDRRFYAQVNWICEHWPSLVIIWCDSETAKCSKLSWSCFEYPDILNQQIVISNRVYPCQSEARSLKKRSPFALATLCAAGDNQHVKVAHQVAFQLRICLRDERRNSDRGHPGLAYRSEHSR